MVDTQYWPAEGQEDPLAATQTASLEVDRVDQRETDDPDRIIDLRDAPAAPPLRPVEQQLVPAAAPVRPSRRGWVVGLLLLAAILLAGYLVVSGLSAPPLASLSAEVVNPGEVSLTFPSSGTIAQLDVRAGEEVHAGQVLATEIVPGLSEARSADAAAIKADQQEIATLKSLVSQIGTQTSSNQSVSVQAAQAEVQAARQVLANDENELALVQAQGSATIAAAQSLLASDEAAAEQTCSGVGSTQSPPTAAQVACADAEHRVAADQLALAQAKASAQATQDSIQSLVSADQRNLADAEAQASVAQGVTPSQVTALEATLAAAEAQLARDEGSLQAASQTAATQTLRAPIAGTVVSVNGAVGEAVGASGVGNAVPSGASVAVTPGFTLFPSTQTITGQQLASTPVVVLKGQAPAYAEILVPESAIGQVHLGDAVTFTPNTQGIGPVRGTVQQIFPRPVVAAGVVSYEVQAQLDGRVPVSLLTGVTGKASILTSSRR
jgi:multidrug efflux pump subunit AcrA (membrane-fusion protein)